MSEFSVSHSFPHLAKGVPCEYQPNVVALVLNILQKVCDAKGWRCVISSGYRSPELNKAVGGVPTSQHAKGEAADCIFTSNGARVPIIDVLKAVKSLGLDFDQMIAYPAFVHLSHTTERANRKQVLYNSSYRGSRL